MKTAIITSLSSTNWSRNSAGLLRRQLLRSKRAWHCSGARSSRHCHDAEKACQLATQRQHWRMLPSHLCRLILVAPLLFIPIASQAADKRGITEKDLFDFVWIGDPQISPDGTHIAFVRITVNEKKDGYNTSIWSVPVAGDDWRRFLCLYRFAERCWQSQLGARWKINCVHQRDERRGPDKTGKEKIQRQIGFDLPGCR